MRRLGCLVFVLAFLGVVLYVGDSFATSYAEERVEARLAKVYDTKADVELVGWPVSARILLTGTIPEARITTGDVRLDRGASIDSLDVVLTDLSVRVDDLRNGTGNRLPPAASGSFTATLDEQSVRSLLGAAGALVRVNLADGVVQLSAGGLRVDATVEARDGDVVVAIAGPLARLLGGAQFPIDLSDQPGSPAVEDVAVNDGVMVVSGSLEDVRR
jgi:hypothetical protein